MSETCCRMPGRDVPVIGDCDVLVAGGGFSGVCAAVGAARAGARAFIVERDGMLGGQAAEVYTFGLDAVIHHESGRRVIRGLPWEIIRRTVAEGQSDPLWEMADFARIENDGPGPVLREIGLEPGVIEHAYLDPAAFRYVLQTLADEAGVTTLLESPLSGTMLEGNRVTGVVFESAYGPRALTGRVVVDTTPQALVAALSGRSYPYPEVYTGTHPRVANVDIGRLLAYLRENPGERENDRPLYHGADDLVALAGKGLPLRLNGFTAARRRALNDDPEFALTGRGTGEPRPLLFFYERDGCGSYWLHRAEGRETRLDDPLHLSRIAADLRRRQWLTHKLFRGYVPGFERAHLVDMQPHIARALRADGKSAGFTEQDLAWEDVARGGSTRGDSVARLIGHPHRGQAADGWQLPYRCLIPKGLDGLLVIGKPAYRFIHYHGTVAAAGHAAGVAAAVAARTGSPPREVPVSSIRDELRRQDATM